MRNPFDRLPALSALVGLLAAIAPAPAADVAEQKAKILDLARSFAGQGDPAYTRQRQLEELVNGLLRAAPQPPVKDRLPLLYGVWHQVWGPYDYRNDKRGVDPSIETGEIYQVVFPDGYYYNISPSRVKPGERPKIGLLRGQFQADASNPQLLRVRFTNLFGTRQPPPGKPLWELGSLAEQRRLDGQSNVLPAFLVRFLFGTGALREVYTDQDLRICYGSNGKDFGKEFIYVMERKPQPAPVRQ